MGVRAVVKSSWISFLFFSFAILLICSFVCKSKTWSVKDWVSVRLSIMACREPSESVKKTKSIHEGIFAVHEDGSDTTEALSR